MPGGLVNCFRVCQILEQLDIRRILADPFQQFSGFNGIYLPGKKPADQKSNPVFIAAKIGHLSFNHKCFVTKIGAKKWNQGND